jgi:hypothetical protein
MGDENLISTYIANMSIEELRDYVKRGRQFALMAIDNLNARWVGSFNAWAIDRNPTNGREWQDIAAEFTLRGLEPPLNLVRDAFDGLLAKSEDPENLLKREPGLEEEIERLHRNFIKKPRN